MKNLTKIFMAVAVAMFAFSCVNDATEDIAVKVGGKTTLAISLENTRTQLGEAADGVYPITWAEGDQITVNGETSEPLAAADADTANAVFTFNDELAAPYCVAYPAAEAGQVVFAAEQEYAEGTFASGAATMYGYATNGNITLNHLTGVLKIGVVCDENVDIFDAPVIQTVRISTVGRAPIAGAFNIDFTTGVVTPTAEAVSVITYNVDMKLNQDPTYLHIAVPAGVYNELYVTLEDSNGGVMYKTVKAIDEKPLAAGNVREFATPIVYVATDEVENLVVRDYSSLLTVKETIEAAEEMGDTATLAKDITFVADVEINPAMTTTIGAWSPIAAPNYKGTVKGNGYAISGLTQPLFDVTAASFKGLHLNVKIEETVKNRVGALACQIIANGNAPVVESCSVGGSVSATVDFKPATADVKTDSGIAGLVGHAAGVDFKDCTNKATVELGQLSTETKTYAPMAGIVGSTSVGNERHTQFANCHNGGALNYYDTTGMLAPCIGGIVGYYKGENANTTFDNCSNSGAITIHKGSISRDCNVGGIIGYSSSSKAEDDTVQTGNLYFTNNTSNSGKITFEGTSSAGFRPGGIIGYILQGVKVTFEGPVTNSGSFTINGSLKDVRGGGILGAMYSSCGFYIKKGAHNTKSATMTFNGTASGGFMFGGMYGYNEYASSTYSSNGSTISGGEVVCNDADFTVNGSIGSTCYLAGFYGFSHNTTTNISGATRIVNNGKMHITKSAVVTSTVYLGGCLGYANGNRVATSKLTTGQLVNRGEIRFEGEAKAGVYIGGVYGCHYASTTCPAINVGNIYAIGKIDTSKTIRIGGITGNTTYSDNGKTTVAMRNGTVYCDIVAFMTTVDSEGNHTFTPYNQVGMYVGRSVTLSSDTRNNFIGGRIATTATVVNGEVVPTFVDITADNYLNYVRGLDGAVPAGSYFSHIASKDNISWGSFKE